MTSATAIKVSPADVASEFEKLRRKAASDDSQNGTAASVRATLANVIFLVGQEDVESLIVNLGKNLPSRFFIVKVESKIKEALEVRVASVPVENTSGQVLQTEQIYITVQPSAVNRIPNILLAQLVPDIDIIIIESEGFCSDTSSPDLKQHLLRDLLIGFANIYVSEDSSKVVNNCLSLSPSCSFRSWSYPLITKWRSVISEQFDSDYVLMSLKNLQEIKVDFSTSNKGTFGDMPDCKSVFSDLPVDIRLLVNWVNKSLGLRAESLISQKPTELIISCVPDDAEIITSPVNLKLTLKDSISSDFNSHILGVSFVMGEEENRYQVDCRYLEKANVIEVSCGGTVKMPGAKEDICDFNIRRIPFHNVDLAEALLIAIRNQPCNCTVAS
jgi:Glucose-6-phosphate dehydrogenase subunit